MKIYLSSLTVAILQHLEKIFPNRKVNVLRSFAMMSPEEHRFYDGSISNIKSVMFDSGVFTKVNAKSGNFDHITLSNYIDYMRQHKKHYEFYANYDEDFTSQGFNQNWKNLQQMRKAGLSPFPVVHDYFMREIQYYLDRGIKYIALGGVRVPGKNGQQRTDEHIKHAMYQIADTNVKTHLFGASSYRLISKYPFYSCDSSSWSQNNRYGFVLYWNQDLVKQGDKTEKYFFFDQMKDYFRKDRNYWETYGGKDGWRQREKFINGLGFSYYDLMGPRSNHYRQLLSAVYYLTIEEVITKKWSHKNCMTV